MPAGEKPDIVMSTNNNQSGQDLIVVPAFHFLNFFFHNVEEIQHYAVIQL